MNYFKALLLLSVTLMLFSCGSDDDDSAGGAQGGSGEVATAQTSAANAAETAKATPRSEKGKYHGRTNGGRPTWYFSRSMGSYPSNFKVSVANCATFEVKNNNGTRFTYGAYIVKQSHVSGRGMALLAPQKCGSTLASITISE